MRIFSKFIGFLFLSVGETRTLSLDDEDMEQQALETTFRILGIDNMLTSFTLASYGDIHSIQGFRV